MECTLREIVGALDTCSACLSQILAEAIELGKEEVFLLPVQMIHQQHSWLRLSCEGLYRTNLQCLAKIVALEDAKADLEETCSRKIQACEEQMQALLVKMAQNEATNQPPASFSALSECWRGLLRYSSVQQHLSEVQHLASMGSSKLESDCCTVLTYFSALCLRDMKRSSAERLDANSWLKTLINSLDSLSDRIRCDTLETARLQRELSDLATANQKLRRSSDALQSSLSTTLAEHKQLREALDSARQCFREEKMRVQEREEAMLAMHQELEEWRRKHAQLLRKSVEAEQNASSQRLTAQPPASSPPRSPSASYGE